MVSVAIPPFLVGALAQPIGADFDFTASDVGLGIAAYYFVSGVLSPLAGRFVAAIGVTRSLHLAYAGSTLGLVWIALATSAGHIAVVLALLGLPNSVVQPASNQVQLLRAAVSGRPGRRLPTQPPSRYAPRSGGPCEWRPGCGCCKDRPAGFSDGCSASMAG